MFGFPRILIHKLLILGNPYFININFLSGHKLSSKMKSKKVQGNKLVAIIGDEDTVTGFLLTGIGERNVKGQSNYMIVDQKSTKIDVQNTFKRFLKDSNISVILITQDASEKYVKTLITERQQIYPVILEIPSKQRAYEPAKDTVMQRAHRLLYGSQIQ